MRLDIVFDTVCPWCFIGKRRLERALAQRPYLAVEVGWRPFLLEATAAPAGRAPRESPARRRGGAPRVARQTAQMAAAGAEEGIAFAFERIVPAPSTLDSHRLVRFAGLRGRQTEMVEILFRAYFLDGLDIGDRTTLAALAAAAGLDHAAVQAYLDGPDDVARIREEDALARRLGVTGVPCFIVDRRYAVSGAQSPEVLLQVLGLALQDAGDGIAAE